MSAVTTDHRPYHELTIKAWALLSIASGLVFMLMFVFGQELLHAGDVVWSLLRYFAGPQCLNLI